MAGCMGVLYVYRWAEVVRAPAADQIFIEFHLDGHKASPLPYCANNRENCTNTNTSSNPLQPHTSWSFVIKLGCLNCRSCTKACISMRGWPFAQDTCLIETTTDKDRIRDATQPSNKLEHTFSAHALQ